MLQNKKRHGRKECCAVPLDQRASAEIGHHAETLRTKMEETNAAIGMDQARLGELFSRYDAASIEDLQTQYFRLQGQQKPKEGRRAARSSKTGTGFMNSLHPSKNCCGILSKTSGR